MRIYWNEDWGFTSKYKENLSVENFPQETLEKVRLPHTTVVTPFNYFDDSDYQMVSGYRREFFAPKEWEDKHVLITFEGTAQEATVLVNGKYVMKHQCGYTAFTVDMAGYLKYGQQNFIVVKLDSNETINQPPFGNVIDYMTYGGIYREVYIEIKEKTYIEDVFVATENVLDATKRLKVQVTLNELAEDCSFKQTILDREGKTLTEFSECFFKQTPEILTDSTKFKAAKDKDKSKTSVSHGVTNVEPWELASPTLYILKTELIKDGRVIDEKIVRFGFREAVFQKDGFYLNGKKLKIRGLNRHQSFPYVGYAMPKRAQQTDASILKYELGLNAVRTSHYPQSHHFLEACDEMGLLVFTEIPGWQHIGDAEWKKVACKNVEEMVLQYRNHPSIVLWGVRINESQDDDAFYFETNKIAHGLDVTRKTGGVRFFKKSHLLEDVYTYNDFLHHGTNGGVSKKSEVTPDVEKPYLITEYNGHMFPTKAYDKEPARLDHALRHAKVVNDYYKNEDIAGGFGWCMFDYNTHRDFGSGDRICYHGVMDMFRNPKIAASVYSSQGDNQPFMELSSSMDIGEYPGGNIPVVYAFTNADSVKVYKNDKFIKEFFPDKEGYGNMPHPPIIVDDFIGKSMEKGEKFGHKKAEAIKEVLFAVTKYGQDSLPKKYKRKMIKLMMFRRMTLKKGMTLYYRYINNWGGNVTTYQFDAMKDGEVVKSIIKQPQTKVVLDVTVDSNILIEQDSYDVASIRFQMKDENNNLLYYYQEPLQLSVTGPIEILGPTVTSLKGGMGGTYIKTTGKEGVGTLTVALNDGQSVDVKFTVEKSVNRVINEK